MQNGLNIAKKKALLKSRIHRKWHKWACCTYEEGWKAGILTRKGESYSNYSKAGKNAEYCRIKVKKGRNPGK
jgi:hypothetical protein